MRVLLAVGLWALTTLAMAAPASRAIIAGDTGDPRERFAVADIEAALAARKITATRGDPTTGGPRDRGDILITFWREPASGDTGREGLRPEGFSLTVHRAATLELRIGSLDPAGAMYGGLELAEQIRARGPHGVVDTRRNPYLSLRGTKFNAPLDLRTPSYSDMGDSAQRNIATMWDFDFWREYLDGLARHRYNSVSLWNLHPFPSMVKVPEFPDVALDDVWRTTARLEEDYSTRTVDLLSPAMLASKEIVKRLTIDAKIDFWRRVMRYAKDRNIDFYIVTWNIFTYGTDGKYGITDSLENPVTKEYFRASVREMFRTYPLLAGIGLTAGENMGEVKMYSGGIDTFDAKENWLFATYGQGVLDAARAAPERRIRLIHRQHESRAQDIAATFKPVIEAPNVDFVFSFKYAQAHILSSTVQTFHRGYVESLGDLKTLWTLRNDDALMFRWAAPSFVREFVRNIPRGNTQGYYLGSDMWVWGREYLDLNPRTPRQLEIDKHWLHFLLWGRMGYDPTLDDATITALVAQRFPGVDAAALLAAWQDASMVYPLVTGFHWADFDFQWYIEGCRSRPGPAKTASGFHSVETFIGQKVHPGTDNIPIPEYVAAVTTGATPSAGTTPVEVARRIDARADAALRALPRLTGAPAARRDAELAATLEDIRAMALLGKYYAAKIEGATALALFRASTDPAHQARAIAHLESAARHWREYSSRTAARYQNPVWTNRVGHVDFRELDAEVARDVEIARAPLN